MAAAPENQSASRQWPPAMLDLQRRAFENPPVGFQAFDTFPWVKDQVFKTNLMRALGSTHPNAADLAQIALQIRMERFAQQTGIVVDRDAYVSWLASSSKRQPALFSDEDLLREEGSQSNPEERRLAILHSRLGYFPDGKQHSLETSTSQQTEPDSAVPSWQRSAPTAELYVPKNTMSPSPGQEPYPKKFQDIFEFIQSGKEIPGIRKIPDTVIEDPSFTTQGQRAVPPKPWEKRSQP